MSQWRRVRLGDFFRIKHGYAFKSAFFSREGSQIVLTPGNFRQDGGLKSQGENEKFYNAKFPSEFLLKAGDLLVVMTDLTQQAHILGSPAFIPEEGRYLHNQRLGKIVELNEGELDPRYLYYLFNWTFVRGQLKSTATGATVKHTSPDRIYTVEVPLPPPSTQRRVASILTAYDDLIENNTRRIAILEEMARRLYEEWFVHFRFPGHEDASFADETGTGRRPNNWEWKLLKDYVELAYGKALRAANRKEGPYPVYGSSGVIGYHSNYLVDGPGIVVGRKGNVGSIHWTDGPFYPIDTVYYVKTNLPMEYVYFNLQRQNFLNNDAAVPGLNRNQAYSLPFLRPSDAMLEAFKNQCVPIFKMIHLLRHKNANLRAQRDLLLPKLISGEIDVSQVSESALEAAE